MEILVLGIKSRAMLHKSNALLRISHTEIQKWKDNNNDDIEHVLKRLTHEPIVIYFYPQMYPTPLYIFPSIYAQRMFPDSPTPSHESSRYHTIYKITFYKRTNNP